MAKAPWNCSQVQLASRISWQVCSAVSPIQQMASGDSASGRVLTGFSERGRYRIKIQEQKECKAQMEGSTLEEEAGGRRLRESAEGQEVEMLSCGWQAGAWHRVFCEAGRWRSGARGMNGFLLDGFWSIEESLTVR